MNTSTHGTIRPSEGGKGFPSASLWSTDLSGDRTGTCVSETWRELLQIVPRGEAGPPQAPVPMGALKVGGIPALAPGIPGGRAAGTGWQQHMAGRPGQAGCIRLPVCVL